MMFKQKFVKLLAIAALGMMPVTQALAKDVTELNQLGPDRNFPRVSRSFPSMDATFSRPGFKRSVAQVAQVQIGSKKRQVVSAIGQPVSAYSDGSWNYNIAFRLPQGNRLICQYRVYFDTDENVAGTLWRRPQCSNIATGNVK
jgi:hypothetical protein